MEQLCPADETISWGTLAAMWLSDKYAEAEEHKEPTCFPTRWAQGPSDEPGDGFPPPNQKQGMQATTTVH